MKTIVTQVFLMSIIILNAQVPVIEWEKSLGGSHQDYAGSIKQTSDGGYIVVGTSISNNGMVTGNHGDFDCWVVKINNVGDIQWEKSLGGSDFDRANAVSETSDGGFVLIGETYSNNYDVTGHYGSCDAWVVKLSSIGDIEWQKPFGGSSADYGYSIQQTTDGGYVLSGSAYSTNGVFNTGQGGWIIKINDTGTQEWMTKVGTFQSSMNSVIQTSDGGYIAAGHTNGPLGNRDYHIVKLENTGAVSWEKYFGGTSLDMALSIEETTDGHFIVAGQTNSSNTDVTQNNGSYDFWVLKINNIGDLQWQKALGGSSHDYAFSLNQTSDGGLVVCGSSTSIDGMVTGNHGDIDYWVVKLDDTGSISWQKTLGGTGSDDASCIKQTADGGFIVAGSTGSSDGDVSMMYGDRDFWIVKLGPDDLNIDEIEKVADVSIYPNPVKDILYIQSDEDFAKVEIYDISGKLIVSKTVNGNKVNLNELPKGQYVLKAYSADFSKTLKLIKE